MKLTEQIYQVKLPSGIYRSFRSLCCWVPQLPGLLRVTGQHSRSEPSSCRGDVYTRISWQREIPNNPAKVDKRIKKVNGTIQMGQKHCCWLAGRVFPSPVSSSSLKQFAFQLTTVSLMQAGTRQSCSTLYQHIYRSVKLSLIPPTAPLCSAIVYVPPLLSC